MRNDCESRKLKCLGQIRCWIGPSDVEGFRTDVADNMVFTILLVNRDKYYPIPTAFKLLPLIVRQAQ